CPDWLCVKGNVGQETLEPGRTSTPRETMFLRNSRDAITWQEFFDYVLSAQNPQIRIVLHYTLDMPSGTTSHEVTRGRECHIDVAEARTAFLDHGFEQGGPVLPPFMQSACLPA